MVILQLLFLCNLCWIKVCVNQAQDNIQVVHLAVDQASIDESTQGINNSINMNIDEIDTFQNKDKNFDDFVSLSDINILETSWPSKLSNLLVRLKNMT